MLLDPEDSHLVLVDYQQRLMPALHDGSGALANACRLARVAQAIGVPCVLTEQNPAGLGATEEALRALVPGPVLSKMDFSGARELLAHLRPPDRSGGGGNARSLPKHLKKPQAGAPGRETLVIAGCEAHVCLLQTTLELMDEEFDVWVVTDACTSRTERNRDAAFDRLAAAGAELVTTEMVAFEWLRGAQHPRFREILGWIK